MKLRFLIAVCAIVVGASSLTLCHPPTPTITKVEVPPYATVTTADATATIILAAFDRAEQAIQARDLDGLLSLYSKRYN